MGLVAAPRVCVFSRVGRTMSLVMSIVEVKTTIGERWPARKIPPNPREVNIRFFIALGA